MSLQLFCSSNNALHASKHARGLHTFLVGRTLSLWVVFRSPKSLELFLSVSLRYGSEALVCSEFLEQGSDED